MIHNDANDYNVLVDTRDTGDLMTRNQAVLGLVDLGDMLHSHTVNDLAIAMAYAASTNPTHWPRPALSRADITLRTR